MLKIIPYTINFTILKTANLPLQQKTNTQKKVWQAPQIELIQIKAASGKMLMPGFNLLDPHGTDS